MKIRYIAAVIALLPLTAMAGDDVGQWYLSPYVGGLTPSSDFHTKSGVVGGLDFGKILSEHWNAELDLNYAKPDNKYNNDSTKFTGYAADALYVFNRGHTFQPFFLGGLGAMKPNIPGVSDSPQFMGQLGVGAFVKLWENADDTSAFALRPEVRLRSDRFTQSNSHEDMLYVVGFTWSFGGAHPAPVVAAAPLPPPPPPPPTPPPPPVVKCPAVGPGLAVDKDGCPIADVVLTGVNFEINSATLTGDSKPILDGAAKGLSDHHRLRVEVQGHTDSTGSDAYNMKLSQRRAESVREYLVSQGVPAEQLEAKGYGETVPVASNATVEGRTANRRVVLHVLANPGDVPVVGAGKAAQ